MIVKKILKQKNNEQGYTLIELLITIVITGFILIAATSMLILIIRTTQRADARRIIRQDMELALDVLRRDIRNAEPSISLPECDPSNPYALLDETGLGTDSLNITLTSGTESVIYQGEVNEEFDVYTFSRLYTNESGETTSYLTSPEVNLKKISIICTPLSKGNKFLLIEISAESVAELNGEKIVEDLTQYTGATIRNSSN